MSEPVAGELSSADLSRLRWRCRRGMRELDVLLTSWLETAFPTASFADQAAFEALLSYEDDAIWDWMMGRAEAPAGVSNLVEIIGRHHAEHRSPS